MTGTRTRIIDADTPGVPRDHGRFNVNGPSVLAAPDWMPDAPGRWNVHPSLNQKTMVAASSTGRDFTLIEPVAAVSPSYLRMFLAGDAWYGVAMPSQVMRSADGLTGFEYGPMLFDDDEIRHCCVSHRPDRHELEMLFTRCYEAPERIYRTVIDTSGDWRGWTPGPVSEVMRPTEEWEGARAPLTPVARGLAREPQNGLRDPCVLEDRDRRWLFYAASGEHAIGVTEL